MSISDVAPTRASRSRPSSHRRRARGNHAVEDPRAGAAATSVAQVLRARHHGRGTGCPSLLPGRPACPKCRSAAAFYKASSTGLGRADQDRLRDQGRARREGRRGEAGEARREGDGDRRQRLRAGHAEEEARRRDVRRLRHAVGQGEPAALHPDHVDRKRSAYGDLCMLRKYVFPVVGETPDSWDVTLEDYERVMGGIAERALPKKLKRPRAGPSPRSCGACWGRSSTPAKLIERNPIPDNAMPNKRQDIALNWVYPSEDAQVLGCTDVDMGLVAGDRFQQPAAGARKSTAARSRRSPMPWRTRSTCAWTTSRRSTWRRFDMRHGIVHMDREKTGSPHPVPIDPDIVRAPHGSGRSSPRSPASTTPCSCT